MTISSKAVLLFIVVSVLIPFSSAANFTQKLTYTPPSNGSLVSGPNYACSEPLPKYFLSLVYSGGTLVPSSQGGVKHALEATSDSPIYIAFSRGSCASVRERVKDIESGAFRRLNFPAFGYPSPVTYKIALLLEYPELDFLNSTRVKGPARLGIRNLGKVGGKTAIETYIP